MLRLTRRARDDLGAIWDFVAQESPGRATTFVGGIEKNLMPLLDHPKLGPERDVLAPGLRAWFYRGYVIYYRADDTEILIVRVVHGARDMATLTFNDDTE